jgi:DNA-binding CsgD family transcriptional regulator
MMNTTMNTPNSLAPNSPTINQSATHHFSKTNLSLKTSPERSLVKSIPIASSTHSDPTSQALLQSLPLQTLSHNPTLLQGVVECLPDGIMIVSDRGELTYDNSCARQICLALRTDASCADPHAEVPSQIWRCCQALIESHSQYQQAVVIEDEIQTATATIRIRVRWLDPDQLEHPLLLVTLEDQRQSAQYRAYTEAHRYRLTERETEVWLLKRAGMTYKAIAAKLHIAEDTVKKHIKNIHARRNAVQWANG